MSKTLEPNQPPVDVSTTTPNPMCPWCHTDLDCRFNGKATANKDESIWCFWCGNCGAALGFQLRTQQSVIVKGADDFRRIH